MLLHDEGHAFATSTASPYSKLIQVGGMHGGVVGGRVGRGGRTVVRGWWQRIASIPALGTCVHDPVLSRCACRSLPVAMAANWAEPSLLRAQHSARHPAAGMCVPLMARCGCAPPARAPVHACLRAPGHYPQDQRPDRARDQGRPLADDVRHDCGGGQARQRGPRRLPPQRCRAGGRRRAGAGHK